MDAAVKIPLRLGAASYIIHEDRVEIDGRDGADFLKDDARAKGATPIMCTLIPRKIWIDGKITRDANTYAGWARQVAASEHTPLIDLNDLIAQAQAQTSLTSYQMAVGFLGKCGYSLLLVYLYYKVFDLAATLGGGMNLGNNMMGAMRAIARDANSGQAARTRANTIGAGRTGGGGGSSFLDDPGDSGGGRVQVKAYCVKAHTRKVRVAV